MGRGEESKGEREGKEEGVEGKKGGVSGEEIRRKRKGEEREGARAKWRGKTESGKGTREGGGVRHLIMTSEVQLYAIHKQITGQKQ